MVCGVGVGGTGVGVGVSVGMGVSVAGGVAVDTGTEGAQETRHNVITKIMTMRNDLYFIYVSARKT